MNPTEEEVLGYVETLRNWDRWGPDDELGTLNFITPEKRVAAAREVRSGRTVSLAHDLNTHSQPNNPQPAAHMMLMTGGGGSRDYIGVACHGFATTHVDAFCHVHWEGAMWNGRPFSDVKPHGAMSNSINAWRDGIVTRGVLLDVAGARGAPWLDLSDQVHAEDLDAAEEFGAVRVEEGDIPVVRTGHWERQVAEGWWEPEFSDPDFRGRPGLAADCLPWLYERRAAAYAGDAAECYPSGYPGIPAPLHAIALPIIGLPLLDNLNVAPLAEACREEERYSFQMVVAPLRIPHGTGSPINPIAIF